MKSVFYNQSNLHPLLLEVIELIKYRINSLSEVKSLSIDPKLSEIDGSFKNEDLFIINEFYQAKGFRKLHLEVARLGKALQILHCVFFPDPCYSLPIFGVDLVIVDNNISAAIVDLSPVWKNIPDYISKKMKLLNFSQFKEPRKLPEWGDIFSPYVCFARPINNEEERLFLTLIDDYLSILFSLPVFSSPDKINTKKVIERFNYQKRYCLNQKSNDKTRSILTKFFGSKWTDDYINAILFNC